VERALGVWVDGQLNRSPHVPWQPKGPTVSWGASSPASPAGWGRGLSPCALHWCSPTSSPGCSLGASVHEAHQTIRACPEEADQDGEVSRGQDLGGVAEVTWLVQPREQKAEG